MFVLNINCNISYYLLSCGTTQFNQKLNPALRCIWLKRNVYKLEVFVLRIRSTAPVPQMVLWSPGKTHGFSPGTSVSFHSKTAKTSRSMSRTGVFNNITSKNNKSENNRRRVPLQNLKLHTLLNKGFNYIDSARNNVSLFTS